MELGEVILTRELERDGVKSLVKIGRPVPLVEGQSDCYVPFRIDSLDGEGEVLTAAGADGVQAMLFALAMIGDLLEGEGLTFLGGEPGFPITVPEEGMYVSTLRLPADMSLLKGST